MPDGGNWTATMWIEYPDPQKCWHELARSSCVAYRLFVEGEGGPQVHAIANEGLNSENAEQTSAEHFLRFELPQAPHQAVRAGAPEFDTKRRKLLIRIEVLFQAATTARTFER